jgi:hypothetical protein
MNSLQLQHIGSRLLCHRALSSAIVAIAAIAALAVPARVVLAQQAPLHLNPAVEKLAQGQPS